MTVYMTAYEGYGTNMQSVYLDASHGMLQVQIQHEIAQIFAE